MINNWVKNYVVIVPSDAVDQYNVDWTIDFGTWTPHWVIMVDNYDSMTFTVDHRYTCFMAIKYKITNTDDAPNSPFAYITKLCLGAKTDKGTPFTVFTNAKNNTQIRMSHAPYFKWEGNVLKFTSYASGSDDARWLPSYRLFAF